MKKLFIAIWATLLSHLAFSQQGLYLSRLQDHSPPKIVHRGRVELGGWYQPQDDLGAGGISVTYAPYFTQALSEIRVKGGYYISRNIQDNTPTDITSFLVIPGAPTAELGVGFTKLFPQHDARSYYEIAFNADFYYAARFLETDEEEKKFRIGSYHIKAGVEIIPVPKRLSFYGNIDLLLDTSGEEAFQDAFGDTDLLLKKSEYFDAGVKGVFFPDCIINIVPEFNIIFTEKRIRDKMTSPEGLIPNFKLTVAINLNNKKTL